VSSPCDEACYIVGRRPEYAKKTTRRGRKSEKDIYPPCGEKKEQWRRQRRREVREAEQEKAWGRKVRKNRK